MPESIAKGTTRRTVAENTGSQAKGGIMKDMRRQEVIDMLSRVVVILGRIERIGEPGESIKLEDVIDDVVNVRVDAGEMAQELRSEAEA